MSFTEYWAKYTFDMQDSAATHTRPIYNFVEGTPVVQNAYFDGTNKKVYNPGKVVCKDEDGNVVDSFYGNYNKPLYFSSTDEYAKQYGLYLEGIYFAKENKGVNDMTDGGKYTTSSNVYYVPVDSATKNGEDPTVKVTIDQNFLYTLWKNGVTSSESKDESIKIYPKYAQRTKKVRFFNTDYPKNSYKYDANNRYSELINVIEAYEAYSNAKDKSGLVEVRKGITIEPPVMKQSTQPTNGVTGVPQSTQDIINCYNYYLELEVYKKAISEDLVHEYYEMDVPYNSVLNLGVNTTVDKVPDGVSWNTITGDKKSHHTWYKPGTTILFDGVESTKKINEADYTRAQIIVNDDIEVRPVTGDQTLTVMYHPMEKIPDEYKGERTVEELNEQGETVTNTYKGLENAVILTDSLESDEVVGVGEDGVYTADSYTGYEFSFTALPPEGYVTYWIDMTADVDGSGVIDFDEVDNARRGSDSPDIIGNVFKGQVTADRPRFYYFFIPKTDLTDDHTIEGRVYKNGANFAQLAKGLTVDSTQPVTDALVNVGGSVGNTDKNGKYKIESNLPFYGTANVMITGANAANYYTYQELKANATIVLPALERFKADSITADIKYSRNGSDVTDTIKFGSKTALMTAYNGKANVTVKVSSDNAITPAKARFFIVDQQGTVKIECEGASDYTTVNTIRGNSLTSTITFNPKKDTFDGEKLVVQFCDGQGNWYRPIDTGIIFADMFSMDDFAFPLLGSSALDDVYQFNVEHVLMGNPLGDLSLEKLPLNSVSETYSPSSLSEEARENMYWTRTSLSYSWGKDFGILSKSYDSSKKKKDDKKKDSDTSSDKSSDKDSDKSSDSGSQLPYDPDDSLSYFSSLVELLEAQDASYSEDTDMADAPAAWPFGDSSSSSSSSSTSNTKTSEPKKSSYTTKGNFKFSIAPNIGFRLTVSQRPVYGENGQVENKFFFEDLLFYVQVNAKTGASCSVALPVGITISMGFDFNGQIKAIYYMFNDYRNDPNEGGMLESANEYLTPFDVASFGIFNKYSSGSTVRREFFLFIDPTITVSLGVKVKIFEVNVTAKLAFDMDWRWTQAATYAYGDMAVYMNYKIKVAGFSVYSSSIGSKDGLVKQMLFQTPNQDGHIKLDTSKAFEQPSGAAAALLQSGATDGVFSTSDVPERGDKSAWNGTPDTPLSDKGTTEITLETGAESDAQVQMMKINDRGEMLMVFIDDDHSRSDVNRRALYYSIGNGTSWSTPKLLDDDGTLDDYPDICDLGNGKLLVSWSSADKVLPDNAGVEDALKALDIKVAFFDKNTKTFDKPEKLTKTTEEDFTADLFPHAAYDAETDRIILYYTKTQFEDIDSLEELGAQSTEYSVTAYLFYEFKDGKWSNDGLFYNDKDPAATKDEEYRSNWYGQRFLDLRTDSDNMKLVVDSTAIGYNGLGLYAWTVDNDDDMSTTDDRDVFLQIYEFSSNTFTHVIKLTNEQGEYSTPKFARSNSNTYLFFGKRTNDTDEDHGEIDYLNISEIIKGKQYTKVDGTTRPYYVLKTSAVDADGNPVEITINPDKAIQTDNYEDYQPVVADDGKMYILWGDKTQEVNAVQIKAAYFVGEDDESTSGWSEEVVLTDAPESIYYNGIGAAIIGSDIKIGALKSNFENETDNSLVFINHTPFADVVIDSLTIDSNYPMPGDAVVLTAAFKNTGLLAYDGDIKADFTCEGSDVGTVVVEGGVQGAAETSAVINVTLPETEGDITYAVSALGQTKELTIKKSPIIVTGGEDVVYMNDSINGPYYAFVGEIANDGNADANGVKISVKADDTELASKTFDVLAPRQREEIKIPIEISNALYMIDEDGLGTVDLSVTAEYGEYTTDPYNETVYKVFDADSAELLDKVTWVKFEEDGKASMKAGDKADLQPEISGIENGELSVKWQMSSDPTIEKVETDGEIRAVKDGKVTLTGIVLPEKTYIEIDAYGREKRVSAADKIPADKLKFVEVELTVSGASDKGIFGDLDGDGEITSADALKALRISAQLDESTSELLALGDIDGDGQITSADALELLRFSTSLSTNDKIGKAIA